MIKYNNTTFYISSELEIVEKNGKMTFQYKPCLTYTDNKGLSWKVTDNNAIKQILDYGNEI